MHVLKKLFPCHKAAKGSTKEQIVQLATQFVQQRGYNGFSYQDIAEQLEIKKASIHYHFASKEDLGIAVIDSYFNHIQEWIVANGVEGMTPRQKLKAYFRWFFESSCECKVNCAVGILFSEMATLPPHMRKRLERFDEWHQEFVAAVIKDGIDAGEFTTRGTPKEQALFLIASTLGALDMALVRGNPDVYHIITKQIDHCLTSC